MQQKTLKYVLIVGVIFVWGMIIYQIIAARDRGDTIKPVSHLKSEPACSTDTFSLIADYQDPFVPDSSFEIKDTVQAIPSPIVPPVDIPKPDLSYITYNGMIANSKKKTKIGIVQVSGKDILIKEKEEYGNILFRKITHEWLLIVLNKKEYKIFRQK